MTKPERSVEEIVEEFKDSHQNLHLGLEITDGYTGMDLVADWLTQTLQTERQKRDEVVEARDKEWKEAIQDNIWPGKGNEHTNNVLKSIRTKLTQTLQTERQKRDEVVKRCIKEVNYYRATPRVRRDFCEWCDEVLLSGDNCNCKTETVRQELLDLITSDLQALTQTNNPK